MISRQKEIEVISELSIIYAIGYLQFKMQSKHTKIRQPFLDLRKLSIFINGNLEKFPEMEFNDNVN